MHLPKRGWQPASQHISELPHQQNLEQQRATPHVTPLPQEPSVERRRPVGVADEDDVDRVEVWKVAELVARPDENDAGGVLDDREAAEV